MARCFNTNCPKKRLGRKDALVFTRTVILENRKNAQIYCALAALVLLKKLLLWHNCGVNCVVQTAGTNEPSAH